MWRRGVVCSIALLVALAAYQPGRAESSRSTPAPAAPPLPPQPYAFAVGAGDAPMAVRSLDDPANPYLGQYSGVDRWIYDHAWTHDDLVKFRADAAQRVKDHPEVLQGLPKERTFVGAFVDPEGWMRPVGLENAELDQHGQNWPLYDRFVETRSTYQSDFKLGRQIFAGPPYPRGLSEENDQLLNKYNASQTPRIPDWLGQHPARRAVFLPDGTIFTYGPPRELPPVSIEHGFGGRPGGNDPGLPWLRYSADGKLLAEIATDAAHVDYFAWVDDLWPARQTQFPSGQPRSLTGQAGGLFWIEYESKPAFAPLTGAQTAGLPADVLAQLTNPLIETKPVAAYRFDGTPLDIMQPLPAELRGHRELDQGTLADVYRAQQHYGIWLGHNGLDEASAAPADSLRRIATGPNGQTVAIRGLDDPGNPYRGLYTPFDRWLYAHWAPKGDSRLHNVYNPADPNFQSVGDTDADGWLRPDSLRNEAVEAPAQTPREIVERMTAQWRQSAGGSLFRFDAYGPRPSAALLAAAAQRFDERLAQRLPTIPAWLGAAPPDVTVFIPNGDILCFHAATPQPTDQPQLIHEKEVAREDGQWQRYSPAGELLHSYTGAGLHYNWREIYFPGIARITSGAQLIGDGPRKQMHQEQMALNGESVTVVYTRPGGFNMSDPNSGTDDNLTALAAYDYDGTPLSLDAPLPNRRGIYYCLEFKAQRIHKMYAVQQRLGLTE